MSSRNPRLTFGRNPTLTFELEFAETGVAVRVIHAAHGEIESFISPAGLREGPDDVAGFTSELLRIYIRRWLMQS